MRYSHKGLDLLAPEGHRIVAPINCRVRQVGQAYTKEGMYSIHLEVPERNLLIKILYVEPSHTKGCWLDQGDLLGYAQNIAAFHHNDEMLPHIHLEVYRGSELLDPATLMELE